LGCQESEVPGASSPETPAPEGGEPSEEAADGADLAETPHLALETLLSIQQARVKTLAELDDLSRRLARTGDPQLRSELGAEAKKQRDALQALSRTFDSIASGIDVTQFENVEKKKFDLRAEVTSLLEPLIQQLKTATEGPRMIEHLRNQLAALEQLEVLVAQAIEGLEERKKAAPDELAEDLETSLEAWKSRQMTIRQQRQVTAYELENKRAARKSAFDLTKNFFSAFFQSRGRNLLVGIGAFLGVFLTLRTVHRKIIQPIYIRRTRSFPVRLGNVFFHLFTAFAAVATVLLSLFAVSDWVLLVLVLLFLVGVGWTFVRFTPQFMGQIRMLLNLGPVR